MKTVKKHITLLLLALIVLSGSLFVISQTYEQAYLLKYKHDATLLLLKEREHIKPQSYFFFPDGRVFQITDISHQKRYIKIHIQRTEDKKTLTILLPCR